MKIKDSELKAILAEVEAEFGELLKGEQDKLAKAAEDEPDAPPAESASPAPEASASAPEGSAPAAEASAPAPEASAPAADAPLADAPPADASADPAADPAADAGGPADLESLKAEYAKLPPEELKVHFLAAKAALFDLMGGGDPAADAAPAAPAPAAPAPEASAPAPAFKGELKAGDGSGKITVGKSEDKGTAEKLAKSELKAKELETLVKDQQAQIDLLAKAVDLALGRPLRKALTTAADLKKEEAQIDVASLPRTEVIKRLSEVAKGNLKKSDRQAITAFTLGHVEVDKVEHLLKQ